MPTYQAVLFDFFGTLTRSVQRGPVHRSTAELLGCPPEALLEVLDRTFYQRACGRIGNAEATLRWVCQQVGVRPSDEAVRSAVASRQRAVRADTRLREEAVPTLTALRRHGVRTGLISDCTHELPAFLPRLPIAPLLDVAVFSVQVGRCKPDPALYLAACRRLGLEPPDCLYVGDGDSQELTGAERVGMGTVRLAAPDLDEHLVFNPQRRWSGPTLRSLDEVLDLVQRAVEPEPGEDLRLPSRAVAPGGAAVAGTAVAGTAVAAVRPVLTCRPSRPPVSGEAEPGGPRPGVSGAV